MTVHVWIVMMKRGCARPTQDMVVGQDGLSGALAVSHVVGESGRGPAHAWRLRRVGEQSHVVYARGKEMKRRHVMTIHALSGVSGHLGHNARLLVGKESEQGKELVMDLPSDFHLKGKL